MIEDKDYADLTPFRTNQSSTLEDCNNNCLSDSACISYGYDKKARVCRHFDRISNKLENDTFKMIGHRTKIQSLFTENNDTKMSSSTSKSYKDSTSFECWILCQTNLMCYSFSFDNSKNTCYLIFTNQVTYEENPNFDSAIKNNVVKKTVRKLLDGKFYY